MRKAPTLLLLLCAMVMPFILFAQVQVSGIVMDANNAPLPGVSVQLRNSSIGTTTNSSGRFSLSIPSRSGVLQFSYVGYQMKTVDLSGAGDQVTVVVSANVDAWFPLISDRTVTEGATARAGTITP